MEMYRSLTLTPITCAMVHAGVKQIFLLIAYSTVLLCLLVTGKTEQNLKESPYLSFKN